MPTLTVYSKTKSVRLIYVLDWLFKERLGIEYTLVHELREDSVNISYGAESKNSISIPDVGLLWETGFQKHDIKTGTWGDLPTFYAKDNVGIPFDIFSALFFLLSRYEEYFDHKPDKHNRYPATESFLFINGWLNRPIVDEWVEAFKNLLIENTSLSFPDRKFQFLPTYDIDIAWSYKNKGAKRIIGALVKDMLTGNFALLNERAKTLLGNRIDPYDSFEWLESTHVKHKLSPIYFILCAEQTTNFDKNIPIANTNMQLLVKQLAINNTIGIHPSYYSDTNTHLFKKEKKALEQTIELHINISRQHYIKNNIPSCYRLLLDNSITDDYSMGYGSHLGFRAGTGSSFLWYDLINESITSLRIHPFCFMDTTAHFEERLTANQAFEVLEKMKTTLSQTNSTLITVFHNFSLGTDKEWRGWKEAYEHFIS